MLSTVVGKSVYICTILSKKTHKRGDNNVEVKDKTANLFTLFTSLCNAGIGRENGLAAIEHYTQYRQGIITNCNVNFSYRWTLVSITFHLKQLI
jgi:hypothetical protein